MILLLYTNQVKKVVLLVLALCIIILFIMIVSPWSQGEARIMFVGDMFFDRYIRKVQNEKGGAFIFSCVGDFLKEADLVVGNLEGPITENASVSLGSKVGSPENFVFTFPTGTAALLARHNVHLVNLGNNHIANFGPSGIESTKEYLSRAGVDYFGGIDGDEPTHRTKIGGRKVTFISYNQFGGAPPSKIAEKIKDEVKEGRTVIVFTHWGEEYAEPTVHMRNTAKLFAEAGARLIIGSHPHVVLGSEAIGSTTVYYSLGNFIFDQYWESAVATGLLLDVGVRGDQVNITERKVVMTRDGRTCLAD